MKSAKLEIYRQIKGMGSSSFMMPAIVIGIEHKTVTRMVNAVVNTNRMGDRTKAINVGISLFV